MQQQRPAVAIDTTPTSLVNLHHLPEHINPQHTAPGTLAAAVYTCALVVVHYVDFNQSYLSSGRCYN